MLVFKRMTVVSLVESGEGAQMMQGCRVRGRSETGYLVMKEVIFSCFVWNTTQLKGNHVSPKCFLLQLLL